MLQVNFIRQHVDLVKERLAVKHFGKPELVDELLQFDERRRKLQFERDELQGKVNAASKDIGLLMREGKKAEAESLKAEVAAIKGRMDDVSELEGIERSINDILLQLPNLPSVQVPAGRTPADNEVVREGGETPVLPAGSVPHWDLVKKYDLIDFELGNKITGSGFPVYKGKGARLQRALISYFLDFNTNAGYLEVMPPHMVNEASAYGTGQLPDKEGQMYHAVADNFYLIPTAEVPVTNIYRDEIVKESELPIMMTAYTPCFRREAGSYGKDVRGLNRLHQFDKVELVQLVHPDKSYDVLEEMVLHVEKLIISLGLPYRILRLCGGDMSFTSALTYDFEVYSAAQEKWLEVSSVSNFENYQTNRMKIRFKDSTGKMQLVHSLNGSSMALPRIVAALLENNQTTDGIDLPEVLWDYFGAKKI
ncbi:serine--tRNA ligase [Flavihumibacter sp.]|uniref:serine--tRNA ligase n=1 Tax=Flavihumibacter sp. TaxID=1913981 RepID=UPI002FC91DDA|nr:serine--tRNA ligase [Flavihumibacter sediminis]